MKVAILSRTLPRTMSSRVVHVKVFPDAKKEKFIVHSPDVFEVYIRESAQRNMANTRVRECVAEHLEIPVTRVTIQTGHRSRKKTLVIKGD